VLDAGAGVVGDDEEAKAAAPPPPSTNAAAPAAMTALRLLNFMWDLPVRRHPFVPDRTNNAIRELQPR
jgi:hypothetical protein